MAPPYRIELRRCVEARLVWLEQPQQAVALEVALAAQPFVVGDDRGLGRGVAGGEQPRPGERRRLDRGGHAVVVADHVVEQAPHAAELALPEDRMPDEAVLSRDGQQRRELASWTLRVKAPPCDRGEARVPVPLPAIALGARAGVGVGDAVAHADSPVVRERLRAPRAYAPGRRRTRRGVRGVVRAAVLAFGLARPGRHVRGSLRCAPMSAAPTTETLAKLLERIAELSDLHALQALAQWDQLVMMPSEGGAARAHQLGTIARLAHERSTAAELGGWLEELDHAELGERERDIVRLARRDWERASKVPNELAGELSHAHAEGQDCWQRARAEDDFAAFAPYLERNVELARAYGECVANAAETPYEGLLGDYDFGLRASEISRVFGELARSLPPLVEQARTQTPAVTMPAPIEAQRAAVASVLRTLGVDEAGWRVDVSAHPFTTWIGEGDSRVTTRYSERDVESLLSS